MRYLLGGLWGRLRAAAWLGFQLTGGSNKAGLCGLFICEETVAPFWRRPARTKATDAGIQAVSKNDGGECRVFLSGRITIDSSPDLRSLLLERLQSPSCRSLTADFSEVVYLDTSVVATLAEVLKSARARGKAFYLTGLRERPHYLLEATRLLHLFDQVNSAKVSQ